MDSQKILTGTFKTKDFNFKDKHNISESHTKVLQGISTFKKEVVDPVSGKSYVSAKIYFLGNRIKHNTNSSKEFLEETGQTHTQNKFIASLKKVFNQIQTKGIE